MLLFFISLVFAATPAQIDNAVNVYVNSIRAQLNQALRTPLTKRQLPIPGASFPGSPYAPNPYVQRLGYAAPAMMHAYRRDCHAIITRHCARPVVPPFGRVYKRSMDKAAKDEIDKKYLAMVAELNRSWNQTWTKYEAQILNEPVNATLNASIPLQKRGLFGSAANSAKVLTSKTAAIKKSVSLAEKITKNEKLYKSMYPEGAPQFADDAAGVAARAKHGHLEAKINRMKEKLDRIDNAHGGQIKSDKAVQRALQGKTRNIFQKIWGSKIGKFSVIVLGIGAVAWILYELFFDYPPVTSMGPDGPIGTVGPVGPMGPVPPMGPVGPAGPMW
jgi:hypothetical protein